MAGRGGRRSGAGAPTEAATTAKGAAAKTASARFQERADKDFDRIYDALADLAFGVWVEEVGLTGSRRVYQRPPDRGALQTMMDHLKGKAAVTQAVAPDQSITFRAAHVPRPRREGDRDGDGRSAEANGPGGDEAVEAESGPDQGDGGAGDALAGVVGPGDPGGPLP